RKRFAEADGVFRRLNANLRGEDAAALLPEETRQRVRAAARELVRPYAAGTLYQLVKYDPERARNLDRALAAETFLQDTQPDPYELKLLKLILVEGYAATGQRDRALQTAEELVADLTPLADSQRIRALGEYAWLMIQKKTPGPALAVVNRHLL